VQIEVLKMLVLGFGVLVLAPLARGASPRVLVHTLPGATAFPESIGADPKTGSFFTGSLIDGIVYRGSLDATEASVFLPAGSDGRTSVAGVKVDPQSRIWLADAFNGRVLVYDQRARLLHSFVLAGPGNPTVNDIAFSPGHAYITDSSRPFLYRVRTAEAGRPGTTTVEPWLDVSAAVRYTTGSGPFGVNLNGIVASPDGRTLLTVQTNTGLLFRVDVSSGEISTVAVAGTELLFADGLFRIGDHLYVVRNAVNEIVDLKLSAGWRSAVAESTLTDPKLAFPTALARLRGHLLITNSQLDSTTSPKLPFTVLDLPTAAVADDR
jgi:Cu-Zn family superoxide dismutase